MAYNFVVCQFSCADKGKQREHVISQYTQCDPRDTVITNPACDDLKNWWAHPRITQVVTEVKRSGGSQRHSAAPLMYGLMTPTNFSQLPPSLFGFHLTLSSAYHDPARITLPDSPNRDLCDPLVIAECWGYTSAIKTGGACHKTATRATKGKGKDKENTDMIGGVLPQKRALEGEDDPRAERGRPNGSNNYSSADVRALLDEGSIMLTIV
ncbi:hypothetical protein BDR04DRAFT_1120420 [Suillus decipiens]|nr:hypothetical protein BDR04DRAFT_1120420 [Suillus decipiens]